MNRHNGPGESVAISESPSARSAPLARSAGVPALSGWITTVLAVLSFAAVLTLPASADAGPPSCPKSSLRC